MDVPAVRKAFDYSVPPRLESLVRVGCLVRVPFSGRRVAGWVVADLVTPPAGVTLRPLASVTGWGPPPDLVDLSSWAAWRWAGRRSSFLRTASPPRVVRGLPAPPRPLASHEPAPAGAQHGGSASAGVPNTAGLRAGSRREPTSVDELVAEAFVAGQAVVRLAPAVDTFDLVLAAVHLASRLSTLVLAPSVAEAAGIARRLRQAGWPVALMPGEWPAAAAGGSVVVGSRAAAWAPAPGLAAVVVLDAHEEVCQEERAPTWNAWQVGAERARRAGVPCVLVSPCPTLEQLDWGRVLAPSRSREREGWPALEIVDRRADDPRQGLYSERLVRVLRSGAPVACILNRKGRARLLACTACTDLIRCETCQGAMEQRSGAGTLTCRRCQKERAQVCQSCGSTRLKTLRVGVSRVREELAALANVPVGEVTAQTTAIPETGILVGTDALLHRLHAGRSVATVAFLDVDQELLAPRYRAGEQALALLARAARLVGGRNSGGRLLVQTRLPHHEVLAAALHADPGRLAAAERPRRVELNLPPAAAVAQVSGPDAGAFVAGIAGMAPVPGAVDPAGDDTVRHHRHVELLGPDEGRWLIRAVDHAALCDALAAAPRPAGRYRIEVDPPRI
ncbi:MAG TPA: hypothetical protein VNA57_06625 [Acidimicrobiales bacterium]|nr:hypothetical protein [Acidimicrobiales bacterium]